MEVLYNRLNRQAFGLVYRMLGDGAAAEDVVQESFLSVWRQSERIDTARGKLQSLVLTVVHNKAIDLLRSRKSGAKDLPLEPAESKAVEGDFTDRVAAVSLDRIGLGFALIMAFSAGLAMVLAGISIGLMWARSALDWVGKRVSADGNGAFVASFASSDGLVMRFAPAVASVGMLAAGVFLTVRALSDVAL